MHTRQRKLIFIVGLATIMALLVYTIFRIAITAQSVIISGDIFTTVTIIMFLLAELFILFHSTGYFTNILLSLTHYEREAISYNQLTGSPMVDVLIPVHDEPIEIVFKTIVAAQHIDYDHFRIIIIDGSEEKKSAQEVRALCLARGVDYYEVPSPRHGAKAGAINQCLKHIRSPYIAIFDADYRPSRDFLKLIVPQLESDQKLAFVQTPQFYGNLETVPVSRAAQMQQSIFYEYICEGKSIRSATFMCGTNLVIRTEALRSVGGFVESSITEDFATSLQLILKGWKSKYYNQTTAFGDGPRNIREFFRQQYRWSRGTLGIFFTQLPVLLFSKNLSLGQRIEFILSGSYYLIGVVWLILLIMPVIYIILGIPAYMSDPIFYLVSYIPYFILSLTLFFQTLFSRHYHASDWFKTESLALLTAPVYARAAFHAMIGKKASFEKTQKDASVTEIPWDELYFQIFLIILSIIAIIIGLAKFSLAPGWQSISLVVNIFWVFFHLIFLTYFLLYVLKNNPSQR